MKHSLIAFVNTSLEKQNNNNKKLSQTLMVKHGYCTLINRYYTPKFLSPLHQELRQFINCLSSQQFIVSVLYFLTWG